MIYYRIYNIVGWNLVGCAIILVLGGATSIILSSLLQRFGLFNKIKVKKNIYTHRVFIFKQFNYYRNNLVIFEDIYYNVFTKSCFRTRVTLSKIFNQSIYLTIYPAASHNSIIHSLLFTFLKRQDLDISVLYVIYILLSMHTSVNYMSNVKKVKNKFKIQTDYICVRFLNLTLNSLQVAESDEAADQPEVEPLKQSSSRSKS